MDGLKKEIQFLVDLVNRVDTTLKDIQQNVAEIDKTSAVQQQQIDTMHARIEAINKKLFLCRKEIEENLEEVSNNVNTLEKTVSQWRWMIVGAMGVITTLITIFFSIPKIMKLLSMIV